LATGIGTVGLAAFAAWSCGSFSGEAVILILLASALGWFLGLVFIWPRLNDLACKRNGAPFKEGDWVRILMGSHRDQVAQVYELCPERNEVRVDLGEQLKYLGRDAFMNNQVCHEHPQLKEHA
jgi:hypothetical protein